MFDILSPIYSKEIIELKSKNRFNTNTWNDLFKYVSSSNSYSKGKSMEDIANYFLSCIDGIKITGRNIRHFTEEIDLCFCNYSNNSSFWKLGPLVLVECKNLAEKISAKTIRNLSYIMDSKGISSTILFTSSKLTTPALNEIDKAKSFGKNFIVIYLVDLANLKSNPDDLFIEKIALL